MGQISSKDIREKTKKHSFRIIENSDEEDNSSPPKSKYLVLNIDNI